MALFVNKCVTGLAIILAATALTACGGGSSEKSSEPAPAAQSTPAVDPSVTTAAEAAPAETTAEPMATEATAAPEADAAMDEAAPAAEMPETQAAAADGEDYAAFTGDANNGKRVFVKCMACHVVQEGQNRVGPSLYAVVGRQAGSIANFAYSDANKNSGITWTEENLFAYLKNPQAYIPGTKMIFPGLPSPQDRADVIAYLKSVPQ